VKLSCKRKPQLLAPVNVEKIPEAMKSNKNILAIAYLGPHLYPFSLLACHRFKFLFKAHLLHGFIIRHHDKP
jgi:hypothetical protein